MADSTTGKVDGTRYGKFGSLNGKSTGSGSGDVAKCEKRWSFDTRADAMAAMPGIPADSAGRKPIRAYHHKQCGKWHLTSHPLRKPRR